MTASLFRLRQPALLATALVLGLGLSACGGSDSGASSGTSAGAGSNEPTTALGRIVASATEEARKELATQNLDLQATGHPKAEITPDGALLIDGKEVAVNAEQKALLLEYRKGILAVADAGITIGNQGADLAGKAIAEAITGIFSGEPERIEERIEVEARKMETAALALCEHLPALKQAQDNLAASLPEFAPYAKMDMDDMEKCRGEIGDTLVDQEALQHEIRDDVRAAIRTAVDGDASEAAAEAEAAGTAATR